MPVYTTYNCIELTGGGYRALDSISVGDLNANDRATVMESNSKLLFFEFNATSTDAEDVTNHPYKVRPNDYSTQGVWEEQMYRETIVPISIDPAAFVVGADSNDYSLTNITINNRTSLTSQNYYTSVKLPSGLTVTELKLYGYRDDASATMTVALRRNDRAGTTAAMASASADWTSGYSSIADATIANALIDNLNYGYNLTLTLNPNDDVGDVRFAGARILFA